MFYEFVEADVRLRFGVAEISEDTVTEEELSSSLDDETAVSCDVSYRFENLNRFFKRTMTYEELTELFVYPEDSNWEEANMLLWGVKRAELRKLIQDYKHDEAVKLIQGFDQKVLDHMENLKACGKQDDPEMTFTEAHHKFYQYIINQVNKEFRVTARDFITEQPHNFVAGKVYWGQ